MKLDKAIHDIEIILKGFGININLKENLDDISKEDLEPKLYINYLDVDDIYNNYKPLMEKVLGIGKVEEIEAGVKEEKFIVRNEINDLYNIHSQDFAYSSSQLELAEKTQAFVYNIAVFIRSIDNLKSQPLTKIENLGSKSAKESLGVHHSSDNEPPTNNAR